MDAMPGEQVTTSGRPFRIVTHKNWLAEKFASFGAVQDFGFGIDPNTAPETVWWAPGAWVASARKAGVDLPLMSCGPYWLDRLPSRYRGRSVVTQALHTWTDGQIDAPVFVKLAEAKLEGFEARVFGGRYLASNLRQFHLPPDTLIQVQAVVEFFAEIRFFIAFGQIVAWSYYRIDDMIWGSEQFAHTMSSSENAWIRADWLDEMRRVVRDVLDDVPVPPGFVLDIGVTRSGQPLVIEANAAWSSGPYDADPAGVFKAIRAAHDFDQQHPDWAWQPNPMFHRAGPLKLVG
jgi:hypothetical protein